MKGFCYQENTHFSQAVSCSREEFWERVRNASTIWKIDSRRDILDVVARKDAAGMARWQKNTGSPNRIALGTLTIYDTVAGFTVVCTGVSLQKVPDRRFDRTGTNLQYVLLATTITEQ